jgi:ribose/xylose/arabinose/galactoside ABC-type transport system permease subunit
MKQVWVMRAAPRYDVRHFVTRYGAYLSLALLLATAYFVTPEVYSRNTLFLILRQASQLGLVAIGQTLVMLVAGLDLSVTGVIVMTSVIVAEVGVGQDSRILPGVLLALLFGGLVGLGNGLLVTKRNVPPLVATLGMLVLVRGALLAHTRGIPSGQVPAALSVLSMPVGPLPLSFLLWIAFNILFGLILIRMPYGRRIYAVGSNREAARLSGIPVSLILISVYLLCALMATVAGIVLSGYVGYVDRYLGRGFDLDSITAAVIGGTAFTGGRGTLMGTMVGVLLVQFLSSMLLILGLDIEVQLLVKGVVVIAAVALYSSFSREGEA